MATINRAKIRKELEPGLNALFGLEYARYEPEHEQMFDVETSEKAFEEEVMQSGFGAAPVKAEGETVYFDDAQNVWTARYDHETIAIGFVITEEAVEDGLYGSVTKRYTKASARSMAHTKQTKGAAIFNNGFDSGYLYGDGKELFATDHPLTVGGVLANEPAVDADLNETSLEDMLIQIGGWTDERGLLINVKGRKLLVHRSNRFVAERLLKSELRTDTAENDINALRSSKALPEGYMIGNYFTDPDAWFIKTDAPDGGKHFVRRKLRHAMEDGFDNEVVKSKHSERYSFGVSDFRGYAGSKGA